RREAERALCVSARSSTPSSNRERSYADFLGFAAAQRLANAAIHSARQCGARFGLAPGASGLRDTGGIYAELSPAGRAGVVGVVGRQSLPADAGGREACFRFRQLDVRPA